MTVACVIPARYQSTRFPGKLLAKALGKTVLQRTFESALQCPDLSALFVATDDERIAEHVRNLGGEVIWTPAHCRNGTERIGMALQNEKCLQNASMIVNLQGDHPCTSPITLEKISSALKENPDAVVATGVVPIHDRSEFLSPHIVKCVFSETRKALYFSRSPIPYSQEGKPLTAFAHLGIYCYRREFLEQYASIATTPLQIKEDLEQLKILESGYHIQVALVDEKTPGVDVPSDLLKLEEYLNLCNTR